MENIEERLQRLSQSGCLVCGFTVNNASPEQQERFLKLLHQAAKLEILALTMLADTELAANSWQKELSEKYRAEKKIELCPERVEYFYQHTLPELLKILPLLPALQELYLFGVNLTPAQQEQISRSLKFLA